MNVENLREMADYLDKGEFGGHPFSMGAYQCCVLGHYVARELQRRKVPVSEKTLSREKGGRGGPESLRDQAGRGHRGVDVRLRRPVG